MKAAIYLRVSSAKQTTENQRPDVERVVSARGLEVVAVFEEQASAVKRRPEFERMMNDARRGRFAVLVVWALDRFGRSMEGNLRDVLELDRLGVQVVSVREPWMDTGGPVRSLLVAIFSWVAQQERARLVERTCAGLDRAKKMGKRLGRPRVELPADWQARVARWREETGGKSVRKLAALLGCSVGTAHTIAKEQTTNAGRKGADAAA